MNYLDLLTEDSIEYILNKALYNIDKKIRILSKKINKLKLKLNPLSINYYKETNYTYIEYDNIIYNTNNYLFSNLNDKNDIILINLCNDLFGYGKTFKSSKLYKPTYLDILIEANLSIVITQKYNDIYFKGLNNIPNKKLLKYSGIRPKHNVQYYELILCDNIDTL